MDLRDEAEELAMAIELGLANVDEAVDWAVRQILAIDQPPYVLIELSEVSDSHPLDVAHLLRGLPGAVDVPRACRRLFSRMLLRLATGEFAPESVARALDFMQLYGHVPDETSQYEMSRLNDAFELAREGTYGTREEAERDLLQFLEEYAEGAA